MINEVLLNCISAFLRGEKLTAELRDDEWQELIDKSAQQKVTPMVYEALGNAMPDGLKKACKSTVLQIVAGQLQKTAEFLNVYKQLAETGITPLVVKGIICRSVYDKPEYRSSADEDLFIPLEQYPAFHEKMLELGFKANEPDYKNAHEERYMRGCLLAEGHWELFPQENDALNALNAYSESFWARACTQTVEGVEMKVPEPTDHMIFLLLHTYKHFISSGVGVRQICDIAQWSKHYELDLTRIREAMKSMHGEYFAAALFDAGEKYFGMTFPEGWERADSTELLKDALDGGIYGSADMSRKHSGSITLGAVESAHKDKKGIPLMSALFPNRAIMEMSYPWVKKSGALLPVAWGARIIRYIGERGNDNTAAESMKIGSERLELLKKYRII
ncbi:MAG: nucleotidyltransferase family protein [Bacillota bacterium]|nr:nucleotidyltransferase family protein [Bacillota bacterium]